MRSTGFYRNKAKSLLGMARALVERFGGQVPRSIEELVSIPGVGRKTANVLLGACFGQPAIVVDTHLKRVSARLGLADAPDPDRVEAQLRALVPAGPADPLHLGRRGARAAGVRREKAALPRVPGARAVPLPGQDQRVGSRQTVVNHDAPLSIRPLRAADIPQVSALIRNTLLLTNLPDYDLETIQALMPTFSTEAVGALARRREMFVGEEEGRLSGVLGLEAAEVYTFFVAPDRQGHGVGRTFLHFAEDLARKRGIKELRVSASLTAVGFYERLGYHRTGAENDSRFGRTVDLLKRL